MMIASMLKLSRSDCAALKIKDAYSLHRAVYTLFPGNARDFLFADKGGDFHSRNILILSERRPAQPTHGSIESKVIPEEFLNHDLYGFQVSLNPVKCDKKTGKRVAIRGREEIAKWFIEKAPKCGFEVVAGSLEVRKQGVQSFDKAEYGTVTHNTATIVGKLKVADRDTFHKSFCKGIGRGKGFGFGLLQIVPLKG